MQEYGHILLVEDDESLAYWVQDYLTQQGFRVKLAGSGPAALDVIREQEPDTVLLDIMLPGLDGLSVCRQIRQFSQVPIIMLTAQSEEMDEVVGLEMGANDYVVKPVRPRALLARIKNQLLKEDEPGQHQLIFGRLTINLQANRVILDKEEIGLTSAEFSMLAFMAQNAGRVVGRDEAFRALKGREYDGQDRWFDVMISVLRKKLKDDSTSPRRIKTAWGRGYLFVADAWG